MAHLVMARKWRPKKFHEVVGQDAMVKVLRQSLMTGQFGHAYLFCGTRGIGKTTMARIFARGIRCEQFAQSGDACGECPPCSENKEEGGLNILEIDGAGHNSVDEVRTLVENAQYLPTVGRHKVYIIDEVHMLSKGAFNALLKTLEEPPAHVVFILATTHPEKLLDTVLSRCQRFDFRPLGRREMKKYLAQISQLEGLSFTSSKLFETLAAEANGSIRDGLSLLEQLRCYDTGDLETTEKIFYSVLGVPQSSSMAEMVDDLLSSRPIECSKLFRQLISQNVEVGKLAKGLLDELYRRLNSFQEQTTEVDLEEMFWVYETLAKDFQWALKGIDPEKMIEIVLQKVSYRRSFFQKLENPSSSEGSAGPSAGLDLHSDSDSQMDSKPGPVGKSDLSQRDKNSEAHASDRPEDPPESSPPISPPLLGALSETKPSVAGVLEEFKEEVQSEQSVERSQDLNEVASKRAERVPSDGGASDRWKDFVKALREVYPLLASNLEQGSLEIFHFIEGQNVSISLEFASEAGIFYQYLSETPNLELMKSFLQKHFALRDNQIELRYDLNSSSDEQREDGSERQVERRETLAELGLKEQEAELEEKRFQFLQTPLVLAAQEVFGKKIDKVILDQEVGQR